MKRKFRSATANDFSAIDAIRNEHGSIAPRMPGVHYFVLQRDKKVTAFFGLKMDGPTRALIVDMYGTNAYDWHTLAERICSDADKNNVEVSGWCFIDNKNVKYFEKDFGFKKTMYLMRRQPNQETL